MDRRDLNVRVWKAILLASVAVLATSAGDLAAQDDAPAFDVVAVKPNVSGGTNSSSLVMPGARYTATNATLRMLIKTAYQVHDDQIIGGPGWVDSERFDVTARGPGNPTPTEFITQARLMLRAVLIDRFQLALRKETRDIPVYALMPARRDGRFGPQFRRADEPCSGPGKPLPVAPDAPEPVPELLCDAGFSRPGHVGGRGRDFPTLVRSLATWADRVLVDRTGLAGRFDWDLQWTPESSSPEVASAPNVLPLVTALRDQLGFRLEPQRSSAQVLVIDRAERPRPD
jgi:uncharacterized protein (TIGR03435 family)